MIEHEATIRLAAFAGTLGLLLLAEQRWPRRAVVRAGRWLNNLVIVVINTALLRLLFPLVLVAWAVLIQEKGWGLFNWLELPAVIELLIAVLVLDMAIYWQHRLFHQIPLLWRIHRMHHSDVDFDVTTAVRFHPLEILLSMLIKFALVTALGASALAVLIFEILLSSASLFEHANLRIPLKMDRRLRALIVTPDMHRIHHSVFEREHNSNYGFSFSIWDRLFRSYTAQP
ncbi:MAG: sterol desaturase family protein, partial [Salinisphaeraceae bacterium]|nr:sterol desaturase family protein [Salinisphaeraceae bacterium]